MQNGQLEHVNVTVKDAVKTAQYISEIFGWKIRWSGPAINGGHTVHIGSDSYYIALYSPPTTPKHGEDNFDIVGGMNHIGIVVDDLDTIEKRVKKAGFKPCSHGDYEPGKRFYFDDHEGIEFEVVSYA